MKFWEAMKAIQEGKTVRFTQWAQGLTLNRDDWMVGQFDEREFDSDDWEVYEEPKPTLSFMEVVKGLKEGKRFWRPSFGEGDYIGRLKASNPVLHKGDNIARWQECNLVVMNPGKNCSCTWNPTIEDFEATDWEEVE